MTKFYSKSTGGFYDDALHGARRIRINDPAWVRPTTEVLDPNWQRPMLRVPDPDWQQPMIEVIDPAWTWPMIEVPDPTWNPEEHPEGTPVPMVQVPDKTVAPKTILVPDEGAGQQYILVPDEAAVQPTIVVPDLRAVPPTIEVENPDCLLPADAVELTDAEYDALMSGQVGGSRIVSDATGRPVLSAPPPPSPTQVWESIKAKRDAIKAGGVKVGTKWYHTDTESRIQHLGLLEKARAARAAGGSDTTRLQALGKDIQWKTMDGSFIYLTVKHAEDIFAAVTDLDAATFAAAETHRAAMEASADPATYDFSAGWPATFAG